MIPMRQDVPDVRCKGRAGSELGNERRTNRIGIYLYRVSSGPNGSRSKFAGRDINAPGRRLIVLGIGLV
jgi:hypothetical protein